MAAQRYEISQSSSEEKYFTSELATEIFFNTRGENPYLQAVM